MVEGAYGPETTITTTFTNSTGRPLYLVNCNGSFSTGLQQKENERWIDVWAPEMNACLSPPIVIQPGEHRSTTIVPASGAHAAVSSRDNSTRINGGTYRVAWHGLYTSFDMNAHPWGEELPLEQRVSAAIIIDPPHPLDPQLTSPQQRPGIIRDVHPPHGATVSGRETVSVLFAQPASNLIGEPQLFIDREWIDKPRMLFTESRPPASLELSYQPHKPWSAGRHRVRVIYRDAQKQMKWYEWSFEAK
jgi:hypothetical protein